MLDEAPKLEPGESLISIEDMHMADDEIMVELTSSMQCATLEVSSLHSSSMPSLYGHVCKNACIIK